MVCGDYNFLFLLCGAISSSESAIREDAMCAQLVRSIYVIITLLKIYFMRSQREEKKLVPADPSLPHCRFSKVISGALRDHNAGIPSMDAPSYLLP